MQNHYNLVYREEEREMMPTLKVRFLPHLSQSSISGLLVFSVTPSILESVPFRGVHSPEELSLVRWMQKRQPGPLETS